MLSKPACPASAMPLMPRLERGNFFAVHGSTFERSYMPMGRGRVRSSTRRCESRWSIRISNVSGPFASRGPTGKRQFGHFGRLLASPFSIRGPLARNCCRTQNKPEKRTAGANKSTKSLIKGFGFSLDRRSLRQRIGTTEIVMAALALCLFAKPEPNFSPGALTFGGLSASALGCDGAQP